MAYASYLGEPAPKNAPGISIDPFAPSFYFRSMIMTTLRIQDLPYEKTLDRETQITVRGGIGRTPTQILAGQISGRPATSNGLVLGDDGRLTWPLPGLPHIFP